MNEQVSEAPQWFIEAINTAYDEKFVEVEGCPIHYLDWGGTGKPGLLLVHGGGAHAHWWDFIAPAFLDKYHVIATDLSGMGDSGHRETYAGEQFARELIAVCEDAGFNNDISIIGHSFGGMATVKAGLEYPEKLKGIIVLDSAIMPPGMRTQSANDLRVTPFGKKKVYRELETALARFKLVPPQPCENKYILDYIARHSLMQVEGGWSWKFDMDFLQKTIYDDLPKEIPNIKCKTVVMYGEKSILFAPAMKQLTRSVYPDHIPMVEIPKAQHHVFLDEPLAFIEAAKKVLVAFETG